MNLEAHHFAILRALLELARVLQLRAAVIH